MAHACTPTSDTPTGITLYKRGRLLYLDRRAHWLHGGKRARGCGETRWASTNQPKSAWLRPSTRTLQPVWTDTLPFRVLLRVLSKQPPGYNPAQVDPLCLRLHGRHRRRANPLVQSSHPRVLFLALEPRKTRFPATTRQPSRGRREAAAREWSRPEPNFRRSCFSQFFSFFQSRSFLITCSESDESGRGRRTRDSARWRVRRKRETFAVAHGRDYLAGAGGNASTSAIMQLDGASRCAKWLY